MSFRSDLKKFQEKLEVRTSAVFAGVVMECARSIQDGSELTSAPGQPVQTGQLRASWITEFHSADHATISTNSPYARSIEDGVSYSHDGKPLQFHSSRGGAHSLKLTIAGFQRIADFVVQRLSRGR